MPLPFHEAKCSKICEGDCEISAMLFLLAIDHKNLQRIWERIHGGTITLVVVLRQCIKAHLASIGPIVASLSCSALLCITLICNHEQRRCFIHLVRCDGPVTSRDLVMIELVETKVVSWDIFVLSFVKGKRCNATSVVKLMLVFLAQVQWVTTFLGGFENGVSVAGAKSICVFKDFVSIFIDEGGYFFRGGSISHVCRAIGSILRNSASGSTPFA